MGKCFSIIGFLFITCITGVSLFCSSVVAADSPLRLALLPIPDVLPVYVAQAQGYFEKSGVVVEPLTVGSAVERDQLMQAGRIDGMINELSGAASFNREKNQVKVIAIARAPIGDSPLFRVLGAPGSSLKSVQDLAGVPIGISKNTVIEYITTRMLVAGGVAADAISYRSVPVLPERLQLLLSGQLKAVTLPDPLAASAIKAGAVDLVNDTSFTQYSASVITFSSSVLAKRAEAVKGFMVAWDRAVADINANPEKFRDLMLKKIRVPGNVRADFPIPPLPRKALPTEEQWKDVMDWMVERKLLSQPLSYKESVSADFLAQ